jgi:hypothetical protein
MKSDWISVIRSVAPSLATALGGPLAGAATAAVSDAVFGKKDASEEEISEALSRPDSETLLRLQEADQRFQTEMATLQVDLERIAAADRSDARTRDIATNDKMPATIGSLVTLGFFGLLTALVFYEPPVANSEALYIMLGSLGTAFTGIVTYYFGSSVGSKQKTDLFANIDRAVRK